VLALIVTFSGINIPFVTDDPALYASISKNLLNKNSFFELFSYNRDWLDKPHFPFWCILLSFKIFGVSAWAYRLPALLFFAISLVYTFLFTRKYYGAEVAAVAVLILTTALQIQISNTDVRAEPYLMALIMGSIYHISNLEERFKITDFLLAALLIAFAVMTKGIFVLIAIYGSLIGQLLLQKKITSLFKVKWLGLFLLSVIFTFPEIYALYVQFDLHPEKTVFGTRHVSGIKWFLWDSQFGRFVNNGPISRRAPGSVFFYLHTLLWAFAPWCLLFYAALVIKIKNMMNGHLLSEYYSLSAGLLLLVLFSLSRFQLPFYTNAVFPLFAIITAPLCVAKLNGLRAVFRLIALWIFVLLLPAAVIIINFFLKPDHGVFFGVDCILFGLFILLVPASVKEAHKKAFFLAVATALFTGFYLNTVFYRVIVPYNGQQGAASYVNTNKFDNAKIYTLGPSNNIFQFYCKKPVELLPIENFKTFKPAGTPVFYVSQQSLNYLKQTHAGYKVVHSFINYPQENILPKFIDKEMRYQVLDSVYLIRKPN
jgi:4-amino-4-deoxy-L-arabinose transferase-like glycosyltransferase